MASKKGLSIAIKSDDIIYTSITKSKDNYNSARLVTKVGDKAYMNVSVEWEGESVPSFAMDLMATLQANASEVGKVIEGREEEYGEFLSREESALPPWLKDKDKKDKDKKKKGKDKKDKEKSAENCKGCGATIYTRKGKDANTCPGCGNLVEPKKLK